MVWGLFLCVTKTILRHCGVRFLAKFIYIKWFSSKSSMYLDFHIVDSLDKVKTSESISHSISFSLLKSTTTGRIINYKPCEKYDRIRYRNKQLYMH